MPVKIRLQRKGRKKRPFYHIVIADARAPRDGRFIEKLGTYNPMTSPATIDIDREKAYEWLTKGAQPTDTVRAILRFKGVMYKKHLQRGVKKGSLTQELADEKYNDFVNAKEAKAEIRRLESVAKLKAYYAKLSGVAPKIEIPVVEAPVVEETPATVEETPAETTEENTDAADA